MGIEELKDQLAEMVSNIDAETLMKALVDILQKKIETMKIELNAGSIQRAYLETQIHEIQEYYERKMDRLRLDPAAWVSGNQFFLMPPCGTATPYDALLHGFELNIMRGNCYLNVCLHGGEDIAAQQVTMEEFMARRRTTCLKK